MSAFEDFILDLIKIKKGNGIDPLSDSCDELVGSSGSSGGIPGSTSDAGVCWTGSYLPCSADCR